MELDKMRKQAVEILLCKLDKLEEKEIPEIDAMYFRNIDRGGGALIISRLGEMLFVDPFFVDFDDHLKRFISGERSKFE